MGPFNKKDRQQLYDTLVAFFDSYACTDEFVIVALDKNADGLILHIHSDRFTDGAGAKLTNLLRQSFSEGKLDITLEG